MKVVLNNYQIVQVMENNVLKCNNAKIMKSHIVIKLKVPMEYVI